MRIEVRPLEIKRWHNKKGKESFKNPIKIQALVDPYKMTYSTGLSSSDIDKLKNKGFNYDLTNNYMKGELHPFWDSSMGVVKLENHSMFFDTENPVDFIKVKIMKASEQVANSKQEWENGIFPDATHVIYDENAGVEVKATKIAAKKKVIIESANLSKERKAQIVVILSGKSCAGKSDNFVEVALDELTEKNPIELLRYVRMDSEDVSLQALVSECLLRSILIKKGHKIYYMDSNLGANVLDVVEYLKEPENQDLRLRLTLGLED